eukprot:731020-Amphidinium_carterae.2
MPGGAVRDSLKNEVDRATDFRHLPLIKMMSFNVGSLVPHVHMIAALAEPFHVIALQETGLTQSTADAAREVFRSNNMRLLEGHVASWKKNTRAVWRPDTAACPGVAFVVPERMMIRTCELHMPEARQLAQSGRLLIAELMTHARSILVVNVYLHSGAAGQKLRSDAADVVLAEVELHGKPIVIICGDWNESYFSTTLEFPFELCGLHQLPWEDDDDSVTYSSGGITSSIDWVVVSGLALQVASPMRVLGEHSLQHRPVVWSLHLAARTVCMTRMPRVQGLDGPPVDPAYAQLAWEWYQAEIFCLCNTGDVQDAYDLWLSVVVQLLWFDDGEGGVLPGRVNAPYTVSSRKGVELNNTNKLCAQLWHVILAGRQKRHTPGSDDALGALSCVEEYLGGRSATYVDQNLEQCLTMVERAYRQLVAKTKTEGVNAWKTRLLDSWQKGGAQVYRWLKGYKKSSTFALRRGDGSVVLDQSEIQRDCVQYWKGVYEHCDHRTSLHVQAVQQWDITNDEVLSVMKRIKEMHPTKSPGPDGFTLVHLKRLDFVSVYLLMCIIQAAITHDVWPAELSAAKLVLIPKTDASTLMVHQMRPLTVASVWLRALESSLVSDEMTRCSANFEDLQLGGVPGRQISRGMMETVSIMENALELQHMDEGDDLYDDLNHAVHYKYGALLDLKQFFDHLRWGDAA